MNNKKYFGEQHFDLEKIREKNISKIEKLIEEKEVLNKKYASLKREVLVKVNAAFKGSISQKELDKKIEERFSKLDECLEKEKINVENKIRAEIIHQSKMLLVLKKNEDIYNYYKLITEKPMVGIYAELEQRLYRETLMKNPTIENIIISYSELSEINNKPEKDLSEKFISAKQSLDKARASLNLDDLNIAISLINDLPDGEEKERLQKEVFEISDLIDNKVLFDEVRNLIKEAECNFDPLLWNVIRAKISDLPDCEEKKKIETEFEKIFKDNQNKVLQLLGELEEKAENNEEIETNKVIELSERYSVSQLCFEDEVKERVKNVIMYSNAIVQDEKQKEDVLKETKKIGFKTKMLEFIGFPINVICRSKLYGKILNKKLNKAKDEKNAELINKYEQRIKDRDSISGVRLYQSLDKLNGLKVKLYTDGLSNHQERAYNKSSNTVSDKLYFGMTKAFMKEYDEIINDRDRTINYINQAMEMLATQNVSDNEKFEKIKNVLKISTSQEKFDTRVQEVIKVLDDAQKAGTLTGTEVLAYKEEIDNIDFYKNTYKYNSYKYIDSDIENIKMNVTSAPYVKRM